MIPASCPRISIALVLAALLVARPAWSNGDLFFEAIESPGNPEYVIFGSVKDDRGGYLESATVTISVTEPRLTYTTETDILGRFRTFDIGRAIKGLGYDVIPSRIEVTAAYPGLRVSRRMYRGRHGQAKGAIEVNFVMSKAAE